MIWDLIVSVSDHCLSFYLIHMVEKWLGSLDKGELVGVILVDISEGL